MSEYVFRDAPGFGCDMGKLWEEVGKTAGEYFASNNDDHYGTLHEEIVRCEDCRFAGIDQSDHDYREPLWCGFHRMDVKYDGFCAWGVRKAEE